MAKAISTRQLAQAARRARDAGLDMAAPKRLIQSLDPNGVHCVSNHICLDSHVRLSLLALPLGGDPDTPVELQVDVLIEDFNALPEQEDVLKELRYAEACKALGALMGPPETEITPDGAYKHTFKGGEDGPA